MERFKALDVYFDTQKVGTLATYQNRITAFEYSQEWLNDGFSISPFSLPLQKNCFYRNTNRLMGCMAYLPTVFLTDGAGSLWIDFC